MILLLTLLALFSAWAGTLTVDVLDVGQGDAVLLRTPAGKAVLVDAGEGRSDAVEQLRALGVTELTLAVATHAHADHIGGMNSVLLSIPTKLFLDNGLPHTTATYNTLMRTVELRGIPYKTARSGQSFTLDDGIRIAVLGPEDDPIRGSRSDLNANSVVLRVTHGDDCMLMVGDAEEETEDRLLAQGLEPCEVLKVAHHGSEFASTQRFLEAVRPKTALISVGADNNYGHPGPKTMGRLEAVGARIYRTDRDGAIRLESSGKGWTVRAGQSAVPLVAAAETRSPPPAPEAPAVASDAAPAESTADPTCAYVGSVNSSLFHDDDCSTARRISPVTRACYATREDATAAGRTPALDCKP